jgi:REP element-mobilizing transposase RayT
MARKPRIEYAGAFYHVITRGNQRQRIFKTEKDYAKYLGILTDYKNRYKYILYAYVLMNNHVHLLLETGEIPLSKILQGINQRYTMYFNWRYRTVGHLFQGRYKAILCDKDKYLLSLVKYIHLNPVRAGVVKSPEEYRWSSHRIYTGNSDEKAIVDTDGVVRIFSENIVRARRQYREYMGEDSVVKKEEIYRTIDQRVLGGEGFAEKVLKKSNVKLTQRKRFKEYLLREIAEGVEKAYRIDTKEMRQKGKGAGVSLGRKLFSMVAFEYGYKGREVAEYIQKDPAIVTRYLKEKGDFEREIERVIKMIGKKANVNSQA